MPYTKRRFLARVRRAEGIELIAGQFRADRGRRPSCVHGIGLLRRIRERLIYPVSRDLDLHYFNVDTDALIMAALSHWSKLRIADYDSVLATHPRFVLAAVAHDYLPWHAVREGYRVVPISRFSGPLLYEVESSASMQRQAANKERVGGSPLGELLWKTDTRH